MVKKTKKKERILKIKLSNSQHIKTLMSFYKSLVYCYKELAPDPYYSSSKDSKHSDNIRRVANLIGSAVGKNPIEAPCQEDYDY